MKEFNELAKLVKELDGKRIWAYMLEIVTVIDGTEDLSDEQKQDAYAIASTEFENYDDGTVGANVFAGAAIYTILDERYTSILRSLSLEYQEDVPGDIVRDAEDDLHDLFMEKLSGLLNEKRHSGEGKPLKPVPSMTLKGSGWASIKANDVL